MDGGIRKWLIKSAKYKNMFSLITQPTKEKNEWSIKNLLKILFVFIFYSALLSHAVILILFRSFITFTKQSRIEYSYLHSDSL